MTLAPMPTTDHDGNLPPLHVGDVGHLACILIDGRRWATLPPGDPLAAHLVGDVEFDVGGAGAEGTSHDPG